MKESISPEFVNRINSRNPIWSNDDVLNNYQLTELHTLFDKRIETLVQQYQGNINKKHDFWLNRKKQDYARKTLKEEGEGAKDSLSRSATFVVMPDNSTCSW